MKYDQDISRVRMMAWAVLAVNVALVVAASLKHAWIDAVAAAVWAWNCRLWLRGMNVHQRTRDLGRLVESAVTGVLESRDHSH